MEMGNKRMDFVTKLTEDSGWARQTKFGLLPFEALVWAQVVDHPSAGAEVGDRSAPLAQRSSTRQPRNKPVEIMDREVKRLKQSRIPNCQSARNSRRGPEFTWEREDQMQKKYPHLFTNSAPAAEVAS
ncbi:hypothetical protein Tco_0157759 [Tanacetum coccineum]